MPPTVRLSLPQLLSLLASFAWPSGPERPLRSRGRRRRHSTARPLCHRCRDAQVAVRLPGGTGYCRACFCKLRPVRCPTERPRYHASHWAAFAAAQAPNPNRPRRWRRRLREAPTGSFESFIEHTNRNICASLGVPPDVLSPGS